MRRDALKRAIRKVMAIPEDFRLVEIIVLGVIAALVLAVAVSGYFGLRAAGMRPTGKEMLSVLRGTNGTFYAPERR